MPPGPVALAVVDEHLGTGRDVDERLDEDVRHAGGVLPRPEGGVLGRRRIGVVAKGAGAPPGGGRAQPVDGLVPEGDAAHVRQRAALGLGPPDALPVIKRDQRALRDVLRGEEPEPGEGAAPHLEVGGAQGVHGPPHGYVFFDQTQRVM